MSHSFTSATASLGATDRDPIADRRFWWLYWGFWLLVAISLALAEAQDPIRSRVLKPWEPFVLEITSVLTVGALALLVYRWMLFLEASGWTLARKAVAHVAAAALFSLAHVAITYTLRTAIFGAMGMTYATSPIPAILSFEAAKDVVTYTVIAGLAYAVRLRRREQRHLLQIEQARGALAELKLARLTDQLHPHFLFNCLNSIAALVEENPKAAVTMIARVGDFLREALAADGESTATLAAEFDMMKSYVAIQAVRFEGAIDATFDLPPELRERRVPRLLLQPIVENAVKHSMVRPESPMKVTIDAAAEGDALRVTVTNTLSSAGTPPPDGLGKGLELVRSRLQLRYGDRAILEAGAVDAGTYRVSILLPRDG